MALSPISSARDRRAPPRVLGSPRLFRPRFPLTIASGRVAITRTAHPQLCRPGEPTRRFIKKFTSSPRLVLLRDDHPADAEPIGHHANRPPGKGRLNFSAVGQRQEHAIGYALVFAVDRERKACEFRLALRADGRGHHGRALMRSGTSEIHQQEVKDEACIPCVFA
jgi:hypothetical protein